MRAAIGCLAVIAVFTTNCQAAGPAAVTTIRAPVRLPAVTPSTSAPIYFQSLAATDLRSFEPTPVVEFDLGLPKAPRTTVGGWFAVGYRSGEQGP